MFCSQCAHSLTPSDVYCPKCAKPVASFNFDPGQIPHVEYVGDDEQLTAVRMPPPDRGTRSRSWLAGAVIATLAILLTASVGYIAFLKPTQVVVTNTAVVSPTPDQSAEIRRAELAARNAQIAVNKAAAATPVPSPIDIDAERAKIDERERRQRESNAASNAANVTYSNSARNTNIAMNTVPTVDGYPMFDRQGRRIRAICNNGNPSYWQLDRWAVCGANGGVRKLYW